jgi:hypothetical protein
MCIVFETVKSINDGGEWEWLWMFIVHVSQCERLGVSQPEYEGSCTQGSE